jgi:opacity protein-like surface antigen
LVFSLSAIVFILLTTAISHSFGADLDSYIALKLGIYSPQEDPFKDFDTGINGEISVGTNVTSNFGLELGVGYFESEGPGSIVTPGPVVVPADVEFFVIPVTVNAKYLYPLGGFVPYAEAGIGVYVADAELSGGGFNLSDTYTNIGVFLGAGVNFSITKKIFFGVEGRYHWVARHKFELGQATQGVEIDGFTATANVGYRFSTDWNEGL